MIRVLVDGVIYRLQEYGGVNRYFTETFDRVGHHSNDVQIILHVPARCQGALPNRTWIRHVKDWNLTPRSFPNLNLSLSVMSKAIAWTLRPQIFHSTYYTAPYWSGLRSVVTVHDFIHERFPAMLDDRSFIARKRHVIEGADAIIANSHSTKDDILKYTQAQESKIVVIYRGVSETLLSAPLPKEEFDSLLKKHGCSPPYWLYVGQRGWYKNFGTLLRAFARISRQVDGYLVAIGGSDCLEQWEVDFLIENRLEQRVIVLSAVDDQVLAAAYHNAAGFAYPSLAEGFGIPLLEAMACGAPIIASDIPVFHEIASDAALYFDPHDEEALAKAMTDVLDKPTRRDLAEKGRKRVTEFSWDKCAAETVNVYKSLI